MKSLIFHLFAWTYFVWCLQNWHFIFWIDFGLHLLPGPFWVLKQNPVTQKVEQILKLPLKTACLKDLIITKCGNKRDWWISSWTKLLSADLGTIQSPSLTDVSRATINCKDFTSLVTCIFTRALVQKRKEETIHQFSAVSLSQGSISKPRHQQALQIQH